MSTLPTTLWGAINHAKLDLRKYHLEENPKKKEILKAKAIKSMENADNAVGPGPHRFMSSRHNWRNECLFLNYYEEDRTLGRYWEDDTVQWSLESIPEWAMNPDMKMKQPKYGYILQVRGRKLYYTEAPELQKR